MTKQESHRFQCNTVRWIINFSKKILYWNTWSGNLTAVKLFQTFETDWTYLKLMQLLLGRFMLWYSTTLKTYSDYHRTCKYSSNSQKLRKSLSDSFKMYFIYRRRGRLFGEFPSQSSESPPKTGDLDERKNFQHYFSTSQPP